MPQTIPEWDQCNWEHTNEVLYLGKRYVKDATEKVAKFMAVMFSTESLPVVFLRDDTHHIGFDRYYAQRGEAAGSPTLMSSTGNMLIKTQSGIYQFKGFSDDLEHSYFNFEKLN